jgi:hypothetical protein
VEDIIADGAIGESDLDLVAALITLSGTLVADAAFARQIQRKLGHLHM